MSSLKELGEVKFIDLDCYRTKNIPAIGCYLKDEDRPDGMGLATKTLKTQRKK